MVDQLQIIPDPLFELNWLDNSSIWNDQDWTYSVNLTEYLLDQSYEELLLVFDGIKMGATIRLGTAVLGNAVDQFLRYTYPISSLLQEQESPVLYVSFPKNNSIDVQGRFMACSGGWDWAPYSNTYDTHGAFTFSKGIWKSVYLVYVSHAALTYVVPHVFYQGSYPTAPLSNKKHAPFLVQVTAFLENFKSVTTEGELTVHGNWGASTSRTVTLTPGENALNVTLNATAVNLWWPVGVGDQHLYNVTVAYTDSQANITVAASRQVGFRVVSLVTANLSSNPDHFKGQDGSGNFTMRLNVNGMSLWIRGANMIPVSTPFMHGDDSLANRWKS